jgi:allantoinase
MLELMLTEGNDRVDADRLADALAGAAARRLRLRGKGSLSVGAHADVALVDFGRPRNLVAAELRYRHRQSPFVGRELTARVRWTILRGEPVYRDGRLLGAPRGRLVTPGVPG